MLEWFSYFLIMLGNTTFLSKSLFWKTNFFDFLDSSIMLIKMFCQALVISFHLIIAFKHNVANILATLFATKRFIVFENSLFATIPLLVISEKYCFIYFLLIETLLLNCLLYKFLLISQGLLIDFFILLLFTLFIFLFNF